MVIESLGVMGTVYIAIIIANIGILLGLLHVYIRSYRQIKIGFTIGLILFASIFLLKSIFELTFLVMTGNTIHGNHNFTGDIIGGLIQFVAFTILLKITWDY